MSLRQKIFGGILATNDGKLVIPISIEAISPEIGLLEFDGKCLAFTNVAHRRHIPQVDGFITSDIVVENTLTETEILSSDLETNGIHVGKLIMLHILGKYSTKNIGNTFTLRLKLAGITILSATCQSKTVTDDPFSAQGFLTIRTIGESGTYVVQDRISLGNQNLNSSPSRGSINTTIINSLSVTVQWSAAEPENIFTLEQSYIQIMN